MADLDNIKTDAAIASILKKLKDASKDNKEKINTSDEHVKESNDVLEIKASEVPVETVITETNDTQMNKFILPWFSESDKDKEFIHYAKNNNGKLEYEKIRYDASTSSLASLSISSAVFSL